MSLKRVRLIYNPKSGKGKIIENLDKIIKIYQKYGYIVDFFRVSYNDEKKEILREIEKYDHLLISGGDGTINSYINFLKKSNIDIPIGILPLGTANDFAKNLGLTQDIEKTCEQIINSTPKKVDIGKINDLYFLNIASIGIFSNISQTTDRELIKKIGKLAYIFNGIKELSKMKKERLMIESEEYTAVSDVLAVLILNGKTAGNFEIAYNSKIDDGYFDVIVVKENILSNISELGAHLNKKTYLDDNSIALKYFKTKKLKITGVNDLATDIDGELGPSLPIVVECIEGGIKLLGIEKKL